MNRLRVHQTAKRLRDQLSGLGLSEDAVGVSSGDMSGYLKMFSGAMGAMGSKGGDSGQQAAAAAIEKARLEAEKKAAEERAHRNSVILWATLGILGAGGLVTTVVLLTRKKS